MSLKASYSETNCSTDLVHFTTGCGDVDHLQLHGEQKSDKEQELTLP